MQPNKFGECISLHPPELKQFEKLVLDSILYKVASRMVWQGLEI